MNKLAKAFAYLVRAIHEGAEYPDAFYRAASLYKLTKGEENMLADMYDGYGE